ncbi:MAG: hypothetical protein M3N51_10420 [Actinomycetota bacterium]|nr:hypothetical protein [Actinomycetota bacterium]
MSSPTGPTGSVVVTRARGRAWALALGGLPFLLFGLDLLLGGWALDAVGRAIYASDPPAYEPRDLVWAVVFLVAGGLATGWGVGQLITPPALLAADEQGVCLAVQGPLRSPTCLGWEDVLDLRSHSVMDGEVSVPALLMVVRDASRLPERPWGARWHDDARLALWAGDWSPPVEQVVEGLVRLREQTAAS